MIPLTACDPLQKLENTVELFQNEFSCTRKDWVALHTQMSYLAGVDLNKHFNSEQVERGFDIFLKLNQFIYDRCEKKHLLKAVFSCAEKKYGEEESFYLQSLYGYSTNGGNGFKRINGPLYFSGLTLDVEMYKNDAEKINYSKYFLSFENKLGPFTEFLDCVYARPHPINTAIR